MRMAYIVTLLLSNFYIVYRLLHGINHRLIEGSLLIIYTIICHVSGKVKLNQ